MNRGGAHAGDLVGGHGNADTAATDTHAEVGFATGHAAPDGCAVVGIVDRLGAMRAEVDDLVVSCLEVHDEGSLECEPAVIRADRDPHPITLTLRSRNGGRSGPCHSPSAAGGSAPARS